MKSLGSITIRLTKIGDQLTLSGTRKLQRIFVSDEPQLFQHASAGSIVAARITVGVYRDLYLDIDEGRLWTEWPKAPQRPQKGLII